MANRRRRLNETFKEYRSSETQEAVLEKIRLKGKWYYRCKLHIDQWGRQIPYRKEDG